MTIALADVVSADVWSRENDIDEPPYLWSDLLARRNALGLQTEELAPVLDVDYHRYREREKGVLSVGPYMLGEVIRMERFVAAVEADLIGGSGEGAVVLEAVADQQAFEDAYPDARTLRDQNPYPMALHHVAAGRAAAALTRQGRDVEVYWDGRRADLKVRRLAAGLLKEETAGLLGIVSRRYARFESSADAPPAGLLAELQAIDDFIVDSSAALEVINENGIQIVTMIDDPAQFVRTYPQARTHRDETVYPLRVHRVAVGRRAAAIETAGTPARIDVY